MTVATTTTSSKVTACGTWGKTLAIAAIPFVILCGIIIGVLASQGKFSGVAYTNTANQANDNVVIGKYQAPTGNPTPFTTTLRSISNTVPTTLSITLTPPPVVYACKAGQYFIPAVAAVPATATTKAINAKAATCGNCPINTFSTLANANSPYGIVVICEPCPLGLLTYATGQAMCIKPTTAPPPTPPVFPSDSRLKFDITLIGASLAGIPMYTFRYIADGLNGQLYQGVMAQDLLNMGYENAVVTSENGFFAVNYDLLDVAFLPAVNNHMEL